MKRTSSVLSQWRCHVALGFVIATRVTLFAAEVQSLDADPGLALRPAAFSAEDEKLVRGWFKELGSDAFEVREAALSKIMGKGPAVLTLAKEYFNDPDPEIAASAKSLRTKVVLKFDGFLPTDPALLDALGKQIDKSSSWVKDADGGIRPVQTLIDLCTSNHVKVELDPSCVNPGISIPAANIPFFDEGKFPGVMLNGRLMLLASTFGASIVARGDTLLVTSAENAKRLDVQRFTFDWSGLELSRDEAARVEKELAPFFVPVVEIHSGSSALAINGPEEAIRKAARLIALLKRNAPDAIWPRPEPGDDDALLNKLTTPVALQISTDNPFEVVQSFQKQQTDVSLLYPEGTGVANASESRLGDFNMTTLNLKFNPGAPLGLVLRWCERRAKLLSAFKLVYAIAPGRRIALHLWFGAEQAAHHVCGTDAGFLYATPHEFNEKTDAAVRKRLLDALEPHLALFPVLNTDAHFHVIRGRLLVQGNDVTLRRILKLVGDWRSAGKPPELPAWRTTLDTALDTPVDWDGRGLSAGKVLAALRRIGNVNLFLEDSPDAAAHFELLPRDAELLPPGRYAFRQLLDDLAARAKAQWRVEFGAIVITPK